MGCGGSRIGPQPDKASAKAPPPSFAALIAAGKVVPDEREGPYVLGSYHANVTGGSRGYKGKEGRVEWHATNKAIMALQTSWATIDFEAENAVDPEFMFNHGLINGGGLSMQELRPTVIKAQAAMKTGYGGAFESAHRQAGRRRGVRADRSTAREDRQGAAAGRRAARPPRAVQGRARRGRRAVGVWAADDRRERRGGRGRVVGAQEGADLTCFAPLTVPLTEPLSPTPRSPNPLPQPLSPHPKCSTLSTLMQTSPARTTPNPNPDA